MVNDLRLFWFFPVLLALFIAGVGRGEMPEQKEGTIEELCSEAGMKRLQKESRARLPMKIKIILSRDYPGWFFPKDCTLNAMGEMTNQVHSILGDFDGNGHTDYAVQIRHADKWSLLAFLRKKPDAFKVYILDTGNANTPYDGKEITLYKQGDVDMYDNDDGETELFIYHNDSIATVSGWAVRSYIFERGSFQIRDAYED